MTVENRGEELVAEAGVETDSAEPSRQQIGDGNGHIGEYSYRIHGTSVMT